MAALGILPRSWRRGALALLAGLAAVTVCVAPATTAYAVPSPADIEKQIDQLWGQLEPLIEQYNTVHYQLGQNKAKADALSKQIAPLKLQVDLALSKVGALSAGLYKMGPGAKLGALLESGSPTMFLEQLTTFNQIARYQERSIAAVADLVDKYDKQKQPIDALVGLQQQQDADLSAKKKQIEAQLAQLQQLRLQAYGSTGGTGSLRPVACPFEYIGGAAGTAAKTACAQIGKPYVWAAAGPSSFDCSGLTLYAWKAAGVSLAHSAAIQKTQTMRIARADLRPGDLIFFYSGVSHVGIYMGGGWMVHAPNSGDVVRMAKIDYGAPINSYGRPG